MVASEGDEDECESRRRRRCLRNGGSRSLDSRRLWFLVVGDINGRCGTVMTVVAQSVCHGD